MPPRIEPRNLRTLRRDIESLGRLRTALRVDFRLNEAMGDKVEEAAQTIDRLTAQLSKFLPYLEKAADEKRNSSARISISGK